MNETSTKAGREKSARAMASENPTEFLGKRLLIGSEDYTDLVEACVVSCERNEEEEDGGQGQPRPALVLEGALGGRVGGLAGKDVELWRLVDGEPHIAFTGEVLEAEDGPEETTLRCASPGTWNAEISFGARTSFPGTPASSAAYSVARRNHRYRGRRFPRVSQPFSRRGARDYQANGKLATALEEIRRESGLCLLDGTDGFAEGWLPPPPHAPGEPVVWYTVGIEIDEGSFSAPVRREGSYRDAWAYKITDGGEVLTVARRPIETRGVVPPIGVSYEIELSEDEENPATAPLSTIGHQRTHDAARLFSYRERDMTFTVVSDPRIQRGDVIGIIHPTTERGRGVVRRYAVPVDAYSDDCVGNEKTYQGFGTILSEEWEPAAPSFATAPKGVSQGIRRAPVGYDHLGRLYVSSPWATYDPASLRGIVLESTIAEQLAVMISYDSTKGLMLRA